MVVGAGATSAEQVLRWDAEGQLEWHSPETRDWAAKTARQKPVSAKRRRMQTESRMTGLILSIAGLVVPFLCVVALVVCVVEIVRAWHDEVSARPSWIGLAITVASIVLSGLLAMHFAGRI